MTSPRQKYPTIRISAETHKTVKELAAEDKTSMSEIVAEAVKQYERKRFHERANEIWKARMRDPEERAFWEKEDREIELTFWTPIKEPWDEIEYDEENDKDS